MGFRPATVRVMVEQQVLLLGILVYANRAQLLYKQAVGVL